MVTLVCCRPFWQSVDAARSMTVMFVFISHYFGMFFGQWKKSFDGALLIFYQ
jgi:hypothetical protein